MGFCDLKVDRAVCQSGLDLAVEVRRRDRIYFSIARRRGRSTFVASLLRLLQARPEILGRILPELFFEHREGRKFGGINAR